MPAITREEVAHLARLSRLALPPDELDTLATQLDEILAAVAKVQEATEGNPDVPATSHVMPLTNVYRPDEAHPGLDRDAALAEAPAVEDDRFRVPRILGEEA
ncbi:Asp-tRNA(Asn)/Glu-tRNA(Gln) amidotransferase subunit GatC [Lipingzhangella sp. LS1_29]|uniref:Aspartyl/glutamyl-tRNA(Asn/Gln) amidotransferase subunit C n=1 Tax=Lipingzhangella rawalii TaxID=2055835 RepID=A0ABU2H9S5_9ACTN|nr:Asp-tRNA(Asn)/Glu-tRNA(Gln) amidotransferase subunit GatC [Lipingzhangella rawalii]MDS1272013.1 Asp-tRNA(Asn)/Glu-tRNA(Gln) amidotransferase subunit GatC [Lipingzhangella rawalii]